MTTMKMTMLTMVSAVVATLLLASSPAPVSGQQPIVPVPVPVVPVPIPGVAGAASCSPSLMTSFASSCLNFITNSSASPTDDCCRSLSALTTASAGCACLILTGSIPGVPVNRTLALRLPRTCNSASLQLQCQDASSAQSPAPGPVADAPAPSLSMAPSPLPTAKEPEAPAPATTTPATPTATPPVSQGQTRSTVVPNAAGRANSDVPATTAGFALLLAIGAALMA